MTQRIKNEKYFDGETMDDDKMNEIGLQGADFSANDDYWCSWLFEPKIIFESLKEENKMRLMYFAFSEMW